MIFLNYKDRERNLRILRQKVFNQPQGIKIRLASDFPITTFTPRRHRSNVYRLLKEKTKVIYPEQVSVSFKDKGNPSKKLEKYS